MKLQFKRLIPCAKVPSYAHDGDSGMDIAAVEYAVVHPCDRAVIRTGIAAVIPDGHELQVRPRSGLSAKNGVVCSFGTVDAGYRGEIMVTLYNRGRDMFKVNPGDRIAQLVLVPVVRAEIEEVDDLGPETERGEAGFGSTGIQ